MYAVRLRDLFRVVSQSNTKKTPPALKDQNLPTFIIINYTQNEYGIIDKRRTNMFDFIKKIFCSKESTQTEEAPKTEHTEAAAHTPEPQPVAEPTPEAHVAGTHEHHVAEEAHGHSDSDEEHDHSDESEDKHTHH